MRIFKAVDDNADELVEISIGKYSYVLKMEKCEPRDQACGVSRSPCDCRSVSFDGVFLGKVQESTRSHNALVSMLQTYMRTCIDAFPQWHDVLHCLDKSFSNSNVAIAYERMQPRLFIEATLDSSAVVTMHIDWNAKIQAMQIANNRDNDKSDHVELDTSTFTSIYDAIHCLETQRQRRATFVKELRNHIFVVEYDATHYHSLVVAIAHDDPSACWIDIVHINLLPAWGIEPTEILATKLPQPSLIRASLIATTGHHTLPISETAASELRKLHGNWDELPMRFKEWLVGVLQERAKGRINLSR
ncbi:hypothetical protein LEN26_014227 [Aphanomyces euteiches]|nr:hypothetical protein LEN26_014227 [Aphanomyces euteiches]KAH9116167.1 hypothetical protein AeMF1_009865 [Aphanomyces euteiches]KAH9192204.1 hypothetical protein AeNC1_005821 [Aphanomyces euteiches]